ncbi:MAG TPA: hypothetical protein VN369_08900, partial [Terriglobales bacterium]|nr:hypothetical protein [Terriglobales bacterium]
EMAQAVRALTAQGMTEADAQKQVAKEYLVWRPLQSALGGFLAGGAAGGGSAAVGSYSVSRGPVSENMDASPAPVGTETETVMPQIDEGMMNLFNTALAMQQDSVYTGKKGTNILNSAARGQGLNTNPFAPVPPATGSLNSNDMAIAMLQKLADGAPPFVQGSGALTNPHRIYNAYLEVLNELEQAEESGMTAREYAMSKGVPSSLSDEEAKLLDEYELEMHAEGAGKTTLADWADNTGELAKTSPIKIPENATIKADTKAAGYDQISYKWTDSGYNYEARWHTKTLGAPAGQGNTWVVSRVTQGNPTGQRRVIHIMVGNTWVTRHEWQAAIMAYQNGTMTAVQEAMLKAGHWFAP